MTPALVYRDRYRRPWYVTLLFFVSAAALIGGALYYVGKNMGAGHNLNEAASKLPKMFNSGDSVVVAQVGSLLDARLEALRSHMDEGVANLLYQVQAGAEYHQNSEELLKRLVELVKSMDAQMAGGATQGGISYENIIESAKEEADAGEQVCFRVEQCPDAQCACVAPTEDIDYPVNPRGIFYIVSGPESSGNRYTVAIIKAMGCVAVSGHMQPWDAPGNKFSQINRAKLEAEKPVCAAVHRSFPHGVDHQWPDLRAIIAQVAAAGYEPRVVFITRNPLAVTQSQLKNKMAPNAKQALANIQRAKREIWGYIHDTGVWFTEFQYEQYEYKSYLKYVYKVLGYEGMDGVPAAHPLYRNGNKKYYLDK